MVYFTYMHCLQLREHINTTFFQVLSNDYRKINIQLPVYYWQLDV